MRSEGALRKALVERVQYWFDDERGEALGDLAADTMLAWIEDDLASVYYNQGVRDARTAIDQRIAGIHDDLDVLERPLPADLRPQAR